MCVCGYTHLQKMCRYAHWRWQIRKRFLFNSDYFKSEAEYKEPEKCNNLTKTKIPTKLQVWINSNNLFLIWLIFNEPVKTHWVHNNILKSICHLFSNNILHSRILLHLQYIYHEKCCLGNLIDRRVTCGTQRFFFK